MNKCVNCEKEVFLNPKFEIALDENGNQITIEEQQYFYEADSFVAMPTFLYKYMQPLQHRITLTLHDKIYIDKIFCNECYDLFIKNDADQLLKNISSFKTKR